VPGVNRVLRLAAGAGLLLAVAGCGSPAIPGHGRIDVYASAPGSSASPGAAAPAPTATVSGETVTLGKATIPLTGVAKTTRQGDYLCLTLTDDDGCSLEVIDVAATRKAGGSVSNPAPGQEKGWWWGSDAPSCGSGDKTGPITKSTVVDNGYKKVGSKTALYGYWRVTCQDSDLDFDPRLWWLPTSQIAFREHSTVAGAGEAVDKILAGITYS
jgi:hypothetical protein